MVEDVSIREGISYKYVVGVLERRMDRRVDWGQITSVKILGLDEIALRKGQGNYTTLVTGRQAEGEIVLLGVLPGHEKAEVVDFLRSIPLHILQTIQTVCCDLWEAYTEAVREEIPTARLVVDRFHVAKHYREAADQVGKEELQRLKKELSKKEYQTLKGSFLPFERTPGTWVKKNEKLVMVK